MRRLLPSFAALLAAMAALATGAAHAAGPRASATLGGYSEVPSLNTPATGSFRARILATSIQYQLDYSSVGSGATAAHIHFAQPGVSGGIAVFLCSATGPQACPANGTITGEITAASVIGPASQGLAAGDFDALLNAMKAGMTYVNVHSAQFPAGEMRGQIKVLN